MSFCIPGTITIHQPHFIPWLPYIARTAAASTFVVLDNVQYRKRYFENRALIRSSPNSSSFRWLVVPVTSSTSLTIRDVTITASNSIRKFINAMQNSYSKAPHFESLWPTFESVLNQHFNSLLDLNLALLATIFQLLNIRMPRMFMSSALSSTQFRTKRIIEICRSLELNNVLIGWGASRRIHDMRQLHKCGINFISIPRGNNLWRIFKDQPGLSILDTMFIEGPDIVVEQIADFACEYQKLCSSASLEKTLSYVRKNE